MQRLKKQQKMPEKQLLFRLQQVVEMQRKRIQKLNL